MSQANYDVVVAGGSLSGLLTAREIGSRSSNSVKVLEADHEIGTPEHCGGLVSLSGLRKLGIVPSSRTFRNHITRAKIWPSIGENWINKLPFKLKELALRSRR